jgi:hypothetical protein
MLDLNPNNANFPAVLSVPEDTLPNGPQKEKRTAASLYPAFQGLLDGLHFLNAKYANATNLTAGTVPLARISGLTDAQVAIGAAIAWAKLNKAGSSLADLATRSASDLSSGTLPDARFPATLPAVSGVNLTGVEKTANKGVANGYASLGSDGKIPNAQLPALAITETFVVNTQAAMLALAAQRGDVAVRSDLSKTFILTTDDPTQLANWQELLHPAAPVTSFNGRQGAVTLAGADVTDALGFTPESTLNKGAANGYAPLGADQKVPLANLPPLSTVSVPVRQTVLTGKVDAAGLAAILRGGYMGDITAAAFGISGGNGGDGSLTGAFDNGSSIWQTSQSGAGVSGVGYIGQNFGAGNAKAIRRVVITNYTGDTGYNMSSVKVQYSDDGAAWADVGTYALSTTSAAVNTLDLPASGIHQYWRVLANSNQAAGYTWALNEVEMMETYGNGTSVDLLATDTPLNIAFAAGLGISGAIDYIGQVAADAIAAWPNLAANATHYLYIERNANNGGLSYGSVTTAPRYQAAAPSAPAANQHWFDTSTMTMKVWTGVWEPKQCVFVGEAVMGATVISGITSYALQGRYDSGWFAIAAGSNYAKSHNLGVDHPGKVTLEGHTTATGYKYPWTAWYNGAYKGANTYAGTRNSIWVACHSAEAVANATGAAVAVNEARVTVVRSW